MAKRKLDDEKIPTNSKSQKSESADEASLNRRTLRLAVSIVCEQLFPKSHLIGGHAVGEAYSYAFDGIDSVTDDMLASIKKGIEKLIATSTKIEKTSVGYEELKQYFEKSGQTCAVDLLETRVSKSVECHQVDSSYRIYLTPLFDTFSSLKEYSLQKFGQGFIVIYGKDYEPQPAISKSIDDHVKWDVVTQIRCVGQLNKLNLERGEKGRRDYMISAEFRQEQQLADIAAKIRARATDERTRVRVLAIAGPTSSGKTTFAHKLSVYLNNYGFKSQALSVDHYYLDLPDQPKYKIRHELSDVDFDSIEAMDIPLVNKHIGELVAGERVMVPNYDFKTSLRIGAGTPMTLDKKGILVMEGIHALNPEYTSGVDANKVFRIYISPITGIQIDDFNCLKSTNHRLMRRMTRDYLFRQHSASHTLRMWPKVRNGEHLYIFKHQNNADFVVNSAMEYELPVLKTIVEPLLSAVPPKDPNYAKARELIENLSCISTWPSEQVPSTSLLREFIGNGSFDFH